MAKLQIHRSDLLLEHPRLLDSIAGRVNHSSFPMEDQVRLVQYIQALLQSVWVTSNRFSDFWQHAREDFEAKVLFVSKSVGSALDHADLVVEPLDEPQRHFVLFMTI